MAWPSTTTPPPLGELETRVAALTKTWAECVNERLLETHDVKEVQNLAGAEPPPGAGH